MEELPSGTVTFLLTDIEGSTRLLKRLGDRYPPVLERHERIVRRVCSEHGGAVFKTEGDAILMAFEVAGAAARAAVRMQSQLHDEAWPPEAVLKVRIGLHTGLAYPRRRDYIALALHQAARVVAAANGGHVLASAAAIGAAGELDGIVTRHLGAFRIRDFDGPAELYALTEPGDSPGGDAVRALPAEGHNLRRPPDTFVGRVRERAELCDLVVPGRVVTVLGPGGIGKTRLAIEFGIEVSGSWPAGVWFVDLASLPPGEAVGPKVADVLGLSHSHDDHVDAVVDHLRERAALVILDNCEHVLGSASELVDQVASTASPTAILATSRQRLGARSETAYQLLPLAASDEGVTLFHERASRAVGSASFSKGDNAVVAELCQRLDGLPLAIELAASTTAVLTPREILDGVRRSVTALRRRGRSGDRQGSLHGLLEWSYRLLDPDEQAVLRRLTVFVGTFDLEIAASAVGGAEVAPTDVPEVVWRLADRSLVMVDRTTGDTRYRLLETVRGVAAEWLIEAGDATPTRIALAETYLDEFPWQIRGNRGWITRLYNEAGTMRDLATHLVAEHQVELGHLMALLAVEAPGARHRALPFIRQVLASTDPNAAASPRLDLLCTQYLTEAGDLKAAERQFLSARRRTDRYGDRDRFGWMGRAREDWRMSIYRASPADLDRAETLIRGAVELADRSDIRAEMLLDLGRVLAAQRRDDEALKILDEVVAISDLLDDHRIRLVAWNNSAEMRLRLGDTRAAATSQRAALHLSAELGDSMFTACGFILAARIAAEHGEMATALRLHGAADAILEELGAILAPDDRALSDAMLVAARAALGGSAPDEEGTGRAWSIADAVCAADVVFDSVKT